MFHIKICGIKRTEDVRAVQASGADAIGLNFFPPSARFVDPKTVATAELSRLAAQQGLFRVGVFVNESAERMAEIAGEVGLDAIQLHGEETLADAERVSQKAELPIIRAIKLPVLNLTLPIITGATLQWAEAGYHLLLDADAGSAHGGSGKTLAWDTVRLWSKNSPGVNWTLAGGLSPENVAQAIRKSGAVSVDTASGVEESRGTKSADRIGAFVAECQRMLPSE